ncbi:MAG: hypothetical protein MI892_12580 [Desulfobacterales bacterium]|nr:hypothetical protein [Desulfobacterales bacterium]
MISLYRLFAITIFLLLFGFCLNANAQPNLTIEGIELVGQKRISRTVYEYTYSAVTENSGDDAEAVRAILKIDSEHTSVVDNEVSFGDVSAATQATSKDTFTIKTDRSYPIDSEAFVWSLEYLPPDPGEAGNKTLLGIDSDNNGVRDDIQRYIYFTYPDEQYVRQALSQIAKNYQDVLLEASDRRASLANVIKLNCSRDCLDIVKRNFRLAIPIRKAMKAEILNTDERSLAYFEFNKSLGGQIASSPSREEIKNCCPFDIDEFRGGYD